MEGPSTWRLENARGLATEFSAEPEVRAVLLIGAVSEAIADTFSETHMHVFWTQLPSIEQQKRVLERVGGQSVYGVADLHPGVPAEGYAPFRLPQVRLTTTHGGFEDGCGSGYPIELENDTLATTEQCLDEVLEDHRVERIRFELLNTIQLGLPLYGEDIVAGWKERLTSYPVQLQRRVIENAVDDLWRRIRYAHILVAREDVVEYFRELSITGHILLRLLFGLNKIFGWQESPKRYGRQIARFAIRPDDFYARLGSTFRQPIADSHVEIITLARETVRLATAHVPDLEPLLSRYMIDDPPEWDGAHRAQAE